MEQPQGPHYPPGAQQPGYPQQQPQPPVYPPQQTYTYPPSSPPPARRGTFGRMLRLLTLRSVSGGATLGRTLRPHWFTAIVAALLIVVIAVESFMLLLPPLIRWATEPASVRAASIPPSPAVEAFIKGQSEYNAAAMWDTMNDDFKGAHGGTQNAFQSEIEQERSSGQHYVKFDYIGGLHNSDGSNRFFYFVEIDSPDSSHKGAMSYVFTVDPNGKIADLTMGGT